MNSQIDSKNREEKIMEAYKRVLDRLPFSFVLAIAIIVGLAWGFKAFNNWNSYDPIIQDVRFLALSATVISLTIIFEISRYISKKRKNKDYSVFFVTENFGPVVEFFDKSIEERIKVSTSTNKPPLCLTFRLVNVDEKRSYEILGMYTDNLGLLVRHVPVPIPIQYSLVKPPLREDLGLLQFSLEKNPSTDSWHGLRYEVNFLPNANESYFLIPHDNEMPLLPLGRRFEIPPGGNFAGQLFVQCNTSTTHYKAVLSENGPKIWITPPLDQVRGYRSEPEYAFRLVVDLISSLGEKIRVISDNIYSIDPEPVYPTVHPPQKFIIYTAQDNSEGGIFPVGSFRLTLRKWHAEDYETFLRRITQDYLLYIPSEPLIFFNISTSSEMKSESKAFIRGLQAKYPSTSKLLKKMTKGRHLSNKSRKLLEEILAD